MISDDIIENVVKAIRILNEKDIESPELSRLKKELNKSCINNENVSVIEEYFNSNGSIIDKDGAPNMTYSNIYIYKGGFALKVSFEEV